MKVIALLQYRLSALFAKTPRFIEIPVLKANSVDPDQMPRLHCLLMFLYHARHKWLKEVHTRLSYGILILNKLNSKAKLLSHGTLQAKETLKSY